MIKAGLIKRCAVGALALAMLAGCGSKGSSTKTSGKNQTPQADMDEQPMEPRPAPDMRVVISAPRHGGLRGTEVRVGGMSVWPPMGPGCPKLVRCCKAAKATARAAGLACKLSVVKKPVDCKKALKSITKILQEMGKTVPAACGD